MTNYSRANTALRHFAICTLLVFAFSLALAAENRTQEQGTIVRMRMTDCLGAHHALMDALSSRTPNAEVCPEYVLLTSKVVYVVIGKASDLLLPLADETNFRFRNNEMLIRINDNGHEARFHVKEMLLRTDWD